MITKDTKVYILSKNSGCPLEHVYARLTDRWNGDLKTKTIFDENGTKVKALIGYYQYQSAPERHVIDYNRFTKSGDFYRTGDFILAEEHNLPEELFEI